MSHIAIITTDKEIAPLPHGERAFSCLLHAYRGEEHLETTHFRLLLGSIPMSTAEIQTRLDTQKQSIIGRLEAEAAIDLNAIS